MGQVITYDSFLSCCIYMVLLLFTWTLHASYSMALRIVDETPMPLFCTYCSICSLINLPFRFLGYLMLRNYVCNLLYSADTL